MSKETHKLQKRTTKEILKDTYKRNVYTRATIHTNEQQGICGDVKRDPQTAKETYERDLKRDIQTSCTRETIHTNEQQGICGNVKRDPQTAKETYERDFKRDIQTRCTRETIHTNEHQLSAEAHQHVKRDAQTAKEAYERDLERDIQRRCLHYTYRHTHIEC